MLLPKKGRHNKEDKELESDPEFRKLRNAHSVVESNISMLEHHGLKGCMDKGLDGCKIYVGTKCFSYNLHILGNVFKARAKADEERRKKQG